MISSFEKGAIFVNVKKKIINGNIDNNIKKADMAPKAATWSSLHFFKKSIINKYKFLIRLDFAIDASLFIHGIKSANGCQSGHWKNAYLKSAHRCTKYFVLIWKCENFSISWNKPPHKQRRLIKLLPKMPYPAILSPSLSQVGNRKWKSDFLRIIRPVIRPKILVSQNQKCRFKIAGNLEHSRLLYT